MAAASERLASVHFDLARACLAADDSTAAVQLLQTAATHAAAARATGVPTAARLHLKTLQCLAVAHLKAGSHASALNCARVLAETATAAPAGDGGRNAAAASAGRAARFLCINALCGLCRVEEAVEMLAAAASDADGASELFAESAISVMRAGRADAATAAIRALLAAGSAHAHATVRFFESALADEHARSAALELLAVPDVAGVLKGEPGGDKRTLHLQALLWNTATQQFESKNCACVRCCGSRPRADPLLRRRGRSRALLGRVVVRARWRPEPRSRCACCLPVPARASSADRGAHLPPPG